MENKCCDAYARCVGDDACLACLNGGECEDGYTDLAALYCRAEECASECDAADFCPEVNFVAHTDCTACLQTECCGAIGECFSDEECLSCWNSPNDSCRRRLDHIATQTCGAERCGELCNSPVDYCPGFFVADQTACSD
ncbi:MAG: hypothetical protein AAFX94_13195, partial [Myxococcota bacterium]